MTRSELAEVLAQVASGQYEEALGVPIGASRTQINRAHIRQLNRFKDSPTTREALNRAKGLLTCESGAQRGQRLLRLGKRDEALAQLRASVRADAGAQEHHLLGVTLHQLGRDDEARAHLEVAVRMRGNATDLLWLGYTLERMGLLDEALVPYERAVRMRGAAEECRQMGNVLMVLDRYDEALPLLNRAASMGPTDHELDERRRAIVTRQRLRRVRRIGARTAGILGLSGDRAVDRVMFLIIAAAGASFLLGGDIIGAPLVAAGLLYLIVR
jgi:tetratricopeptide (TPR) repeat protein